MSDDTITITTTKEVITATGAADEVITATVTTEEVITATVTTEEVITATVTTETISVAAYDGAPPAQAQELIQAGQTLSAYKAIVPDGSGAFVYADNQNLHHASIVYGLTKQAINNGSAGIAQTYGPVSNDTWAWELEKPIFLATEGELTQTPPVSGFSLIVAYPITATSIFMSIGEPIMLI